MGGAEAGLTLRALEATPYTGARRGFVLRTKATGYPAVLNSLARDFADLGAAITLHAPIPALRRPTFRLKLAGRGAYGLGAGTGLLQVGGLGAPTLPGLAGPVRGQVEALPDPGDRFFESLRGYEDLALMVDRVALTEATLTYPIIIERGAASSLGVLPASFARQLDLEAFGSAAWDTQGTAREHVHAAVGAAARLRFTFLIFSVGVGYQLARRLTDDRSWTHTAILDFE